VLIWDGGTWTPEVDPHAGLDAGKLVFTLGAALMRRGRALDDADGLVQEAWVRLACHEREQAEERPEAFLMQTALNLSVDTYRTRISHGEELVLDEVILIDTRPTVEATLLARERMVRLSDGVARSAQQLGAQVIAAETDLDRGFKAGSIDQSGIAEASARIAALQGQLRAVHLVAHLKTKGLLSEALVLAYNQARGYVAAGAHRPRDVLLFPEEGRNPRSTVLGCCGL
jgi:hypothetical protein